MIRALLLIVLVAVTQGVVFAADSPTETYYIQLIRGNNDNKPPTPDAKPVGPKLSGRLLPVFKWEHYWEVKLESADVPANKSVRKRLSPEREVEIERLAGATPELAVRIFVDGKMIRETRQPAAGEFFIAGGDKEGDQSWFIVVRHDKPHTADGAGAEQ